MLADCPAMSGRRVPIGGCLLTVVAFVSGCSSSSSKDASSVVSTTAPIVSTTGTATATTTIPRRSPSAGCSDSPVRPAVGTTARTLTAAGVAHPYLLSVPTAYRSSSPTPLVLLFHGFGSDAKSFAALTRMPAATAGRDVIVVTPDGPNHTWQLSGTGSDAAFVDAIVAAVSKAMCVDLHRVYAAGFSQGAAFAIFYTCARPGRIAAFATVAVDFQLGCKQPVPYLAFHGTIDPAVPYDDGAVGASLPGAVRGTLLNMSDWARLDKCDPTPTVRTRSSEVVLRTWPHCTGATTVQLYTIVKGSHTWPGADPKASPLYTTRQIDATALMLSFFAGHHLPAG
jgi:polyhydroxybutyrate depolymerase